MRLYGKKFVRRALNKQTKAAQETRDAILWDIQTETNTCRVKIQGSSEYIIAHFPRNWKSVPYWLKRGNAVRILHRGGNRGYVEVIGEGRAIPTPISGDALPDEQGLPDGIVTGCTMTAMETDMGVEIASGTYRINGEIYSLTVNDQYRLFDSETYALYGSDTYEFFQPDSGSALKSLDAAPSAGSFRYDALCVGIDGVIDYIKGTASATPEKPNLPSDHVLIGYYILVVGGVAVIEEKDIGRLWTAPYAANLDLNIESSGMSYDMPWEDGETTSTASIALQLEDQYGNNYPGAFSGTATKNIGGGTLSDTTLSFTGSKTITWTRDQTISDTDPVVITIDGTVGRHVLTSIGIINPQAQVL